MIDSRMVDSSYDNRQSHHYTLVKILPPSPDGIQEALSILQSGGVVAHATETCYGLACDLRNPDAVSKLFAIKGRPPGMPVSALFASIDHAKAYMEWNDLAEQLATEHLPGPLTIILRLRADAPYNIFPNPSPKPNPTVGLRLSPHPTAQSLVLRFGSPLSTTSANVHGRPNPYSIDDLKEQFQDGTVQPDLVLDDGKLEEHDASTVVDVSDGTLHVLRKGDITL